MATARRGDLQTVRALLAGGADLRARHPSTGGTVLHTSFREPGERTPAHAAVWAELVRAGADLTAGDGSGARPVGPPWAG
jgi:hypothetical protein